MYLLVDLFACDFWAWETALQHNLDERQPRLELLLKFLTNISGIAFADSGSKAIVRGLKRIGNIGILGVRYEIRNSVCTEENLPTT